MNLKAWAISIGVGVGLLVILPTLAGLLDMAVNSIPAPSTINWSKVGTIDPNNNTSIQVSTTTPMLIKLEVTEWNLVIVMKQYKDTDGAIRASHEYIDDPNGYVTGWNWDPNEGVIMTSPKIGFDTTEGSGQVEWYYGAGALEYNLTTLPASVDVYIAEGVDKYDPMAESGLGDLGILARVVAVFGLLAALAVAFHKVGGGL
ncbi:minor virion protein [Clavavirus yamagawaense]|uniref:Minor virion protein n=1 Tax=Aeropyrum pernix bacilliform virus 1 (isolate -/Japan/Tanaka/2005) TaxID=1289471 RepID=D4QF73_APBV1|nr:minor virion protein [Aeropyrum pernix bacilliform virus 1]BAJ06117.1 minor virion protein [Aeropyrum pernix bacilliform virus 1]